MNGISRYHYRLWLLRLTGSIAISCGTLFQHQFTELQSRRAMAEGGEIELSASCRITLEDQFGASLWRRRVLPDCLFEIPGTLPLIWSLGHVKELRNVSEDDLRFVPTIGNRTASRIRQMADASTWSELGARAKLTARQLNMLRRYLAL